MPEGFIRYSDPLDRVLEHLDFIEENGGYMTLTSVQGGEPVARITNLVDVMDAIASGKLERDGLYKVEYVAELVEEA